jgi:hypothetical protein
MDAAMADFVAGVAEALTDARTLPLAAVAERMSILQQLVADAETTEVLLIPLSGEAVDRWQRLAAQRDEVWAFVRGTDGGTVLATDEPSELGQRMLADAVIYPEIHTRLVAWWLIHAWRVVDLFDDTLTSLVQWRITVAPVTARALLEEVGCLLYEARQIEQVWTKAKALKESPLGRPERVRSTLAPVLADASFGSRLEAFAEKAKAVNVLTYIRKLAKATGDDRVNKWYDWLSDAAHPALGARIAMSSSPAMHETKAVTLRCYARRPVFVQAGKSVGTDFTIAHMATDALIACGTIGADLLEQTLRIVDDFGLTTQAAALTRRWYWRDFTPVRGARACPCGRGKWSHCGHRWGEAAPTLSVPQTAAQ